MMTDVNVNWFAILACGVMYMIVGFVWYGPLFARQWMKLSGISHKDIEKSMKKGRITKTYATSFLSSLVTAYVTNILVVLLNVLTVSGALSLGVMLWLGYVATTYATLVLYEQRPFKLYLINTGYYLVTIVLTAVILTLWV